MILGGYIKLLSVLVHITPFVILRHSAHARLRSREAHQAYRNLKDTPVSSLGFGVTFASMMSTLYNYGYRMTQVSRAIARVILSGALRKKTSTICAGIAAQE